jgi:hypothetical protein
MANQGPNKHSKSQESAGDMQQASPPPKLDSPMDKFNKAMRKILSVPKKDISKK